MNFQYVVFGVIMLLSSVFVMPLLHHKLIFIMPMKLADEIISATIMIWMYIGARLAAVGLSRAKILPTVVSNLHLFPTEQEMIEAREWLGETIYKGFFFGGNRIMFMVVLSLLFVLISAFIIVVNTVLPVKMREFMDLPLTIYGVLNIYAGVLIATRVALYVHRQSLTNHGAADEPAQPEPVEKQPS